MTTTPARAAHPIVYLFLIVPFGAMGGYLSVAIGYQLTQAGVSVGEVAALIAVVSFRRRGNSWAPVPTRRCRARYVLPRSDPRDRRRAGGRALLPMLCRRARSSRNAVTRSRWRGREPHDLATRRVKGPGGRVVQAGTWAERIGGGAGL